MLWPSPALQRWCGLIISRCPQHWTSWSWGEQDREVTPTKILGWLQDLSRQCRASRVCQCQTGLEKARDRPKTYETPNLKQLIAEGQLMVRGKLAILSSKVHVFWIWTEWSYCKATHQRIQNSKSSEACVVSEEIMFKPEFAEKRAMDQQREWHNPT